MTGEEKELVSKHIAGLRDSFASLRAAVQAAQQSPMQFVVMRPDALNGIIQLGEISMWAIEDIVTHAEDDCDFDTCREQYPCPEEEPCW